MRVETLDRLFQVAIILGKATEDVFKLTGKNMVRQIQLIWVVSLFDCRYEKSCFRNATLRVYVLLLSFSFLICCLLLIFWLFVFVSVFF